MYADILFLTEFMNDCLILLIVKELNGFQTSKKRLMSGALIGALISTLLAIFFADAPVIINILSGILLCLCMIKIAFNTKVKSLFFRLFLHTYATAFIMGGICSFLQKIIPTLPAILIFSLGFFIVKGGVFINLLISKKGNCLCEVSICYENIIKKHTALIDTGNLLFDKKSKLPVSIISEEVLPEEIKLKATHCISFNSLGCTNGSLKILYVPYICVEYKGEKKLIENAPLGLSTNKLSASDSYQMIISPEIINKMEI